MAIEITGDSPQAVAMRLLEIIATIEKKQLDDPTTGATRQWLLETYKECLAATIK